MIIRFNLGTQLQVLNHRPLRTTERLENRLHPFISISVQVIVAITQKHGSTSPQVRTSRRWNVNVKTPLNYL